MTSDIVVIFCGTINVFISSELPGPSPELNKIRHFRRDRSTVNHLNCKNSYIEYLTFCTQDHVFIYRH